MGFVASSINKIRYNRSLQRTSGKFSKKDFGLGVAGEISEYNEKFSNELSKSKIKQIRESVQADIRKDRMRSLLMMGLISPVVIGLLWYLFMSYINLLSLR